MSQETVEGVGRAIAAFNRRDLDALLKELDPDVEWYPALEVLLGGEETVYRGHRGILDLIRDVNAAFPEFQIELAEVRDLGDRMVGSGRMHARGQASGAEIDSPVGFLLDIRHGKAFRVRTFRDPSEALEAAGRRE